MQEISEQGSFDSTTLGDLLARIWKWRFTGSLRVDYRKSMRILTFKEGDVVGITSDRREDSIDEYIRRSGALSEEQIATVLERKPLEQETATAFTESGMLTAKEWGEITKRQIVTVMASMLPAGADARYLIQPSRIEWNGPTFPIPEILLATIMACEDRHWIAEKLGMEIILDPGVPLDATLLQPYAEAVRLLNLADGEQSVEDICRSSSQDNFFVCKFLYALEILGALLRRQDPSERKKGRRLLIRKEEPPASGHTPFPLLESLAAKQRRYLRPLWFAGSLIAIAGLLVTAAFFYHRWRNRPTPPTPEATVKAPTFFAETQPGSSPQTAPQSQPEAKVVDPLVAAARGGDIDLAATISRERLLKAGLNFYVIVLEIDCLPKSVQEAFLAGHESSSLFVISTMYRGRKCYNVCWGLYRAWTVAQNDTAHLPEYFRRQGGYKVVLLADLLVTD